ncbi:substrate-binding domain-containing protein [Synechococcus sp. CS-1328]|uniref:substrate-binding domain-containing protein n=1 Tax=Synechococcus sp. CS-1328 TaxID=2847976 RepID=UPI00223BB6C0|nr:substrate-binding domain-containing protein [Synechococcus sp. CS-1328]MCT0224774.1 substrate-binding domain-containing protein [Synechococcus sp. CS-1328]
MSRLSRRRFLSLGIGAAAVLLAAAPVPGLRRPLLVVVGSELEASLRQIEPLFETRHGDIDLRWRVMGAQDMINASIDGGPERPRVLIPSNRDQLESYAGAVQARGEGPAFRGSPQPIARTLLVAVAWPERAQRLFPDGRFSWERLRAAARAGRWQAIGGPPAWGSIDLRMTDPLRSNSGQLSLALWARDQPGSEAVALLKRAVYRPARSTDILLSEFVSGGPNQGDLAFVYEAPALQRQGEAEGRWPGGYRMLIPDPTMETVLAAGVRRGEGQGREADGSRFVAFLLGAEGRAVLNRHGFRDAAGQGGSPAGDRVRRLPPPAPEALEDLLRQWQSVP